MNIENMIKTSQQYIINSKWFQFAERIGFYDWVDDNYWPGDNRLHILALKTSRKIAPWALIIGVPWTVFDAEGKVIDDFSIGNIVEATSKEFYGKGPNSSNIVKNFKYRVVIKTPYQTCEYHEKNDFDALKDRKSVMVKNGINDFRIMLFGYEILSIQARWSHDNCGYLIKG